jgi:hypothetical protein
MHTRTEHGFRVACNCGHTDDNFDLDGYRAALRRRDPHVVYRTGADTPPQPTGYAVFKEKYNLGSERPAPDGYASALVRRPDFRSASDNFPDPNTDPMWSYRCDLERLQRERR